MEILISGTRAGGPDEYRVSMLMMLTKMMPELIASWTHDGRLDCCV